MALRARTYRKSYCSLLKALALISVLPLGAQGKFNRESTAAD